MTFPHGRWCSLFTLTCCLAVFFHPVGSESRTEPVFPGKDAPMEELVRFYIELQQYHNTINRPRFGKRSSRQTLCGESYTSSDC